MTKTPVVLSAAFLGAFASFVALIVVWRSFELGDWGDDHMGEMGAIFVGCIGFGALVGGAVGHRLSRWLPSGQARA
ncbi:MAG: hypothetical protein JNK15_19560 [Planctomycetes bacterium]|nr:hypothetical protein [Planctomycetota bacterium]